MPTYTFDSALEIMKKNEAIQRILYKSERDDPLLLQYSVVRDEGKLWHVCEHSRDYLEPLYTLWKKPIIAHLTFRGDVVEPLPPPPILLVRQTAVGYMSPRQEDAEFVGIVDSNTLSGRSSSNPMSPLALTSPKALSRQTSAATPPAPHHLFFDDEGNAISFEEFQRAKFMNDEFFLSLSCRDGKKIPMKHPRVLLAYLRFLSVFEELEETNETPPALLTSEQKEYLNGWLSYHPPSPEFEEDVNELLALVEIYSA